MSRKVWIVAWREYLAVVKRWGFIVTVVLIPLGIVVPSMIMGAFSAHQAAKEEQKPIVLGILDQAGMLDEKSAMAVPPKEPANLPDNPTPLLSGSIRAQTGMARLLPGDKGVAFKFYNAKALQKAQADLRTGDLRGLYVIPKDYILAGKVMFYSRSDNMFRDRLRPGDTPLGKILIESLLRGKVNAGIVQRVKSPIKIEELTMDSSGQFAKSNFIAKLSRNLVPVAFGILLMISLFMASGYLLQGVATEKGNRVMELLLSSVTPMELMGGKLIGLGAAGLTQVFIWLVFAMVPMLVFVPFLKLNILQILLSLLYFLLGYLLFGSLMLGLGSLGETHQEAQQFAGVVTFIAALPLGFTSVILTNPDSTVSRVLAFIPFTAPSIMIIRLGVGNVSWLDTVCSLMILGLSVYIALGLAAKLFRVGVLLYGKRPTIPEIWRWVRA